MPRHMVYFITKYLKTYHEQNKRNLFFSLSWWDFFGSPKPKASSTCYMYFEQQAILLVGRALLLSMAWYRSVLLVCCYNVGSLYSMNLARKCDFFFFLTLLLLSSVVLELGQKVRMGKGSFKLHHNQPQALMCDRIPERGALVALLYVKVYWRLGFTDGAISRNYHTCAARSTMASPTAHKRGCIP